MKCPSNQTLETDSGQPTAVAVWDVPSVADNSGKNLTIACTVDPGNQFDIGKTYVTCRARDQAKNHAMCTFTVNIQGKKWESHITTIML